MDTPCEKLIQKIVDDPLASREIKIQRLRHLEDDARALQRAASESAMNSDDGWQAELRQVRLALEQLGARHVRNGAASL
ncbi:hypothetical protein EDC40_101229 [Aminobacter aminovorans]|uniref:Uncharacterized protein n=1 Tax=Aminobacter aminovorans TaxID=83263 RepID=A0A380WP49_AMIAI|nr:hypothetical protein [Aminobacter aminovorans]TCS29914.1 hypothetical protein EDC40_101229 [Aminobacter aminovorans]SUU90763.1 Uncharacterised protein [Aminobacter aminovorans]